MHNYPPGIFKTIAEKFIDPSRHEEYNLFIRRALSKRKSRANLSGAHTRGAFGSGPAVSAMEQLCELIPLEQKEEARAIINRTSTKRRRVEHDDFDETMKKYLTTSPPLPSFNPTNEDFIDIRSCAALIIKLSKNDYHNRNTLLRSAAFQGVALEKILSICEHKKQVFMGKLKSFEIPHSPSYCYFLIRLSKLINSDVALQNSSMPISFVRNNFKRIEEYVRNQQQQPVLEEEWNM